MLKFTNDPFEYVAPTICITSIILIPLGPLLIPRLWILLLSSYFFIFLSTQLNRLLKFWMTANNIKKTISQNNTTAELKDIESILVYDLVHAIVVPNYAEPEALIRDTIQRIAVHKRARTNYVIILAMETSELYHGNKSDSLREYFKDNFLQFIVTNHPSDLPGEARGKGSNISYAARKGCAKLIECGIDKQRIMITIADSDSHISELYIKEIEKVFNRNDDPYFKVYAPPIFFSRNCFKVPASVRVTDIVWSSMIMSNLSSSSGIGFPCSTYTVSYLLADRVGYWDTDADAVGEDMHMTLKCIFKTKGRARMVPIFVPINLMNVETEGYIDNLWARFVQAKRHYNGVADVSYTLRSALDLPTFCIDANNLLLSPSSSMMVEDVQEPTKYFWVQKLLIIFKVFEAHFIPVTSGWLMFLAVPVMQFILQPPAGFEGWVATNQNPIQVSEFYLRIFNVLKWITFVLPFPLFGTLSIYESLHRFIDMEFLNKTKEETRNWVNYLDYLHTPIAAWVFMTIPSDIASLKRIFKTRDQYIVAEKVFHEGRD
ncbi:hypothetical protein INT48_005241 [Thamnidium elegans]|uniref:Glycosyltransferase 2-like domain-containing protein n=1 Tax=Thamnidium elegans TaxID=101142 RepID=A0A8H7SHR8_9FUNG|nr:hypothetical protein INT48_005241 [Thamnidium elegans]